jgi:predicted acyl esterase
VTGPVRLVLWVASSARDTDFTANLVEVHPDGYCAGLDRWHPARALPQGQEPADRTAIQASIG